MEGQSTHLARAAEAAFERRGDYESLLFEGRWHRSGELFDRAAAVATGLAQLGLEPGERVVVTMTNCAEVGIIYQAVWRAGLVATPAMFLLAAGRSASPARRFTSAGGGHDPGVPRQGAPGGHRARARAVGDLHRRASPDGAISLAELEAAPAGAIVPRADDDLAALLYTGGTTGQAKGVMLSHAALHYVGSAAYAVIAHRGDQSLAGDAAAVARLRTAGHGHRLSLRRTRSRRPAAVVRSRARSWTRSSSTGCSRRRSFRRCCRRCWPSRWRTTTCDAAAGHLGRVAAVAGDRARVHPPRAVGVDPAGVRADRERRAGLQQPRGPRPRRLGGAARTRLRGRDPRRGRSDAAGRRGG